MSLKSYITCPSSNLAEKLLSTLANSIATLQDNRISLDIDLICLDSIILRCRAVLGDTFEITQEDGTILHHLIVPGNSNILDKLSNDVLKKIGSYLDDTTYFHFRRTCKSIFNNIPSGIFTSIIPIEIHNLYKLGYDLNIIKDVLDRHPVIRKELHRSKLLDVDYFGIDPIQDDVLIPYTLRDLEDIYSTLGDRTFLAEVCHMFSSPFFTSSDAMSLLGLFRSEDMYSHRRIVLTLICLTVVNDLCDIIPDSVEDSKMFAFISQLLRASYKWKNKLRPYEEEYVTNQRLLTNNSIS